MIVAPADAGRRLDVFLAAALTGFSRARVQSLIAAGLVAIEGRGAPGRPARRSDRVRAGDRVSLALPPPRPAGLVPEPIPLTIAYEDEHMLVIDKPAGLTVHPGAGRPAGTLVHAVLAHCARLPGIGGENRPGIVHRLDKDTSGLIVVAKTEGSLRALQAQIQARRVRREYIALVHGCPTPARGTIDAPIGRDPRHRTRMAVVPSGRRAVTIYRVARTFGAASLLHVRLETGRTHQIRVHCAHIGHPVIGDPVYGRRTDAWGMGRQALHAIRLSLDHPITGRPLVFAAPIPADMRDAIARLRRAHPAAGAGAASPRG